MTKKTRNKQGEMNKEFYSLYKNSPKEIQYKLSLKTFGMAL